MAGSTWRRAGRVAAVGLAGLGLMNAALAVRATVLNYTSVPFCDQWPGTLAWYLRLMVHPVAAFWEWHNEHRLVVARLVFWADMRLGGGVNRVGLAVSLLLCAAIVWAVARMAGQGGDRWRHAAVAGLAACFAFSWMQWENFTSAFQCQWFFLDLFALLAFGSMVRAGRRDGSWRWIAAALGFAVLATLSMSNGILVFIPLVAAALAWRMGWARVGVVFTAGVAMAAIYMAGKPPVLGGAGPLTILATYPFGVLKYALRYMGAPIFFLLRWQGAPTARLAVVAGGVVVLALLAGMAMAWRLGRRAVAPEFLLFAMFVALSAGATAAGRLLPNPNLALSSRYLTNTLLMLLTLALFLALNLRSAGDRAVVAGALCVACVVLSARQIATARTAHELVFSRRLAGVALRQGVYDFRYVDGIKYFNPAFLRDVSTQAWAHGFGIFVAHPVALPSVADRVNGTRPCRGRLEGAAATGTKGIVAWHGWVLARDAQNVAFRDQAGRMVGVGVIGATRADVAGATHDAARYAGFVGFAPADSGTHLVWAYGGSRPACRAA